jgi:hypothetical protein
MNKQVLDPDKCKLKFPVEASWHVKERGAVASGM